MRSSSLALGIVASLAVLLAWAGAVDSVRDLGDELKSMRRGRVSMANITLLDVRIGRETLDDVRSRFGAANAFRVPPNSASANDEICYSSAAPADETRVIFASGPMGGWSEVTEFQVLSRGAATLPCARSNRVSRSVATQGGIRLDMPLEELRSMLGAPTEQGPGYAVFAFEQKSDHPQRPDFDMISGVKATIFDGRVTSFQVFLIESN